MIADQSSQRPHFHRKEICSSLEIPVRSQDFAPWSFSCPFLEQAPILTVLGSLLWLLELSHVQDWPKPLATSYITQSRILFGHLHHKALEVRLTDTDGQPVTAWAHQQIKREVFDISGGWVAEKLGTINTLQAEPYLKTRRRLHVNAGIHQEVSGYSDSALFERYLLKYMNRLQPLYHYDTDAVLPRIHAVEFLGEPEYGGGTPVAPQDVWKAFTPYAPTRLPTSVTHSEERIWRYYAGLLDCTHYDAYRVTVPSPDSWSRYDRWDGE